MRPAVKSAIAVTCALLAPPDGLPSNVGPLAFGMTPQQVSAAVGAPLTDISRRRAKGIYFAVVPASVPGFYPVDQAIHFQFRNGCLTGWKLDWRLRYRPF
jgi:hypothetical protein